MAGRQGPLWHRVTFRLPSPGRPEERDSCGGGSANGHAPAGVNGHTNGHAPGATLTELRRAFEEPGVLSSSLADRTKSVADSRGIAGQTLTKGRGRRGACRGCGRGGGGGAVGRASGAAAIRGGLLGLLGPPAPLPSGRPRVKCVHTLGAVKRVVVSSSLSLSPLSATGLRSLATLRWVSCPPERRSPHHASPACGLVSLINRLSPYRRFAGRKHNRLTYVRSACAVVIHWRVLLCC
eukprot:1193558-Prorocentrum_minimum.AAC.2